MFSFLLVCMVFALLQHSSDAKMGKSYWMEDLDEAYYDMGFGKGLDVTKTEWQVERVVKNGNKAPKLDGMCNIRFLSSKSTMSSGNVALFSTGEVGIWKIVKPEVEQKSITTCSYDEAIIASSNSIEIEVPSNKPGDRSTVVYNFPMGSGSVQALAVIAKTKGTVKYYANGKASPILGYASEEYSVGGSGASSGDGGIEVGSASMHLKAGKPLVDPAWAKGRRWFWTKKEQGGMSNNPGYI